MTLQEDFNRMKKRRSRSPGSSSDSGGSDSSSARRSRKKHRKSYRSRSRRPRSRRSRSGRSTSTRSRRSLSRHSQSSKSRRSPRRTSPKGKQPLRTSNWATRMEYPDEEDVIDYDKAIEWPDSDDEGSSLIEVSEKTRTLLDAKCTQSVPNDKRRRLRAKFPQPKVPATKPPAWMTSSSKPSQLQPRQGTKTWQKYRPLSWMPWDLSPTCWKQGIVRRSSQ